MADMIIRTVKGREHPYTMVPRAIIEDGRLSWEARAVLIYLLSKPDGWETRVSDLRARGTAGRDQIRRMLSELCDAGYMHRDRRAHGEGGRFTTVTLVYEDPADNPTVNGFSVHGGPTVNAFAVDGSTVDGSTVDGKPVPLESTQGGNKERRKERVSKAEAGSAGDADVLSARQVLDAKRAELEQFFHEQTNLPLPGRNTEREKRAAGATWWTPLLNVLRLSGEDLGRAKEIVQITLDRMYADELTITSPKSIVACATAEWAARYGGNGREEHRGRFGSGGADVDAWAAQEQTCLEGGQPF